jgi:hypothetical protein
MAMLGNITDMTETDTDVLDPTDLGVLGEYIGQLSWTPADLNCPKCNAANNVCCRDCGFLVWDCNCVDLPIDWYCLTCTTQWQRVVFSWTSENGVENTELPPDMEYSSDEFVAWFTGQKVEKELKCVCKPEKQYVCQICGVERNKKTDKWEKKSTGLVVSNDPKSYVSNGQYNTDYFTHKCRHFEKAVVFPDGTIVHGTSKVDRKPEDHRPDLGLYLDASWTPASIAYTLKWPDYGLPVWDDVAIQTIQLLLDAARAGKFVEIGCIGGHGRTGTVLAAMATFCGVKPKQAVKWVRKHYCDEAVETEQQAWWPEFVYATVNNKPVPAKPVFKPKVYAGTTSNSGGSHMEADHYVMFMLGLKCNCSFWKKDIESFAKGAWPTNPSLKTLNERLAPVIKYRADNKITDKPIDSNIKAIVSGSYMCHCGVPFIGNNSCKCSSRTDKVCVKCDPNCKDKNVCHCGKDFYGQDKCNCSSKDLKNCSIHKKDMENNLCHCGKPFGGTDRCECSTLDEDTCTAHNEPQTYVAPANSDTHCHCGVALKNGVADCDCDSKYRNSCVGCKTCITHNRINCSECTEIIQLATEALATSNPETEAELLARLIGDEEEIKAKAKVVFDEIKKTENAEKEEKSKKKASKESSAGKAVLEAWCDLCACQGNHTDGHNWFFESGVVISDGSNVSFIKPGDDLVSEWCKVDTFMCWLFGIGWSYQKDKPAKNTDAQFAGKPRPRRDAKDLRCQTPGCNNWIEFGEPDCPRCLRQYSPLYWIEIEDEPRTSLDPDPGTIVDGYIFKSYIVGWLPNRPVESKATSFDKSNQLTQNGMVEASTGVWIHYTMMTDQDWNKAGINKDEYIEWYEGVKDTEGISKNTLTV